MLFGLFEFWAVYTTQNHSVVMGVVAALSESIPGGVLGLGVWWISGWIGTDRSRFRFGLQHLGLSLLYTVLWVAVIYLAMSRGTGWRHAWETLQSFLLWQLCLGVIAYGIIASVSYAIRTFIRLREEEQRAARAETLRVRAELEALRGKLQPHFLFNTLHSITALVRIDPIAAEEALLKLGELLRYVLKTKRDDGPDDAPLSQELAFVEQYLAIERIRLGDRLRTEIAIADDALECAVPMFTLQPLVENAIHHAISPRAQGGTVKLSGSIRSGRLFLQVSDDGPGTNLETVEKSPGFGLRTVRQRLNTRFNGACDVSIQTRPGKGFTVSFSVPAEEAPDA